MPEEKGAVHIKIAKYIACANIISVFEVSWPNKGVELVEDKMIQNANSLDPFNIIMHAFSFKFEVWSIFIFERFIHFHSFAYF